MNDLKYIKVLLEVFPNVLNTEDKAKLVYNKIKNIVNENKLESFIKEDIILFSSKSDAYDYITEDDEESEIVALRNLNNVISIDMVGKSMNDVIEDILLSFKDGYLMIADDIHMYYYK